MQDELGDRAWLFADMRVRSTRPLPELRPAPPHVPTRDAVQITWTETGPVLPESVAWYHQWGDDDVWARFGGAGAGYVVDFPTVGVFVIDPQACVVDVRVRPGVPDVSVRHLLLNQVLPLVLSRRRPLVLHAGAVAIDGKVTAFVGPTGAGKSTLVAACAALGAEVMADDSLVVYPDPVRWSAVASYPAVRLWDAALDALGLRHGIGEAEPVSNYSEKRRVSPESGNWLFATGARPLARIVLLPGDSPPPRPAAVELFSQVFRLDVRDRAEAVALFHTVADLAAAVPMIRLDDPCGQRRALTVAGDLLNGTHCTPSRIRGIVSGNG
jgi:hypothetical protein